MNQRLTLPVQWSLTLVLGLFLGYVYQPMPVSVTPADQPASPTVEVSPIVHSSTPTTSPMSNAPKPYETLPGGWLVRAQFFRDTSPKIEKVVFLNKIRIAALSAGENQIEILNKGGQILFVQTFAVDFLRGDPPKPVNNQTVIFMLPFAEGASEIVITTVNGKAIYVISTK